MTTSLSMLNEEFINVEIINSVLMSGIPILLVTFGLFAWVYKTVAISSENDPIEQLNNKLEELSASEPKSHKPSNFVMDKWIEFGGGYYGVMALVTFFHAEFYDGMEIIAELSQIDSQGSLLNGFINFALEFFVESFSNIIVAFTWWNYWDDILPIEKGFIWLIVTYVAYLTGEWLAKRMIHVR